MKIAIIGAGFAGLSSARVLTVLGHDVTVYEKTPDVSGVWSATRRYRGLHTQNNKGSRPVGWTDDRLGDVPLVRVSDGSASTGIACAQAEAGLLPAHPTVVVGQQCVLDASRASRGRVTLWLQLQEVPFAPLGDAADEIDTSAGWSNEVVDAYVARVLARVSAYAPGLEHTVLDTFAIAPIDLAAANRNAVAGDPYGGACELDQSLLWRPGSGTGHRTGIDGLFQIGAFTHPGPGLGGGSGHIVAQRLLAPSPIGRLRRFPERFTS